jgi:hypothetical protein
LTWYVPSAWIGAFFWLTHGLPGLNFSCSTTFLPALLPGRTLPVKTTALPAAT